MLAYEKMTWFLIWFVDSAKFPHEFYGQSPQFQVKAAWCPVCKQVTKQAMILGCGNVVMDSLLSWHQMDDGTVVLFIIYFTVCCSAVQGFYVISG